MHRPITKSDVYQGLEYALKRNQVFVSYEFVYHDDELVVTLFDAKGKESNFSLDFVTVCADLYDVRWKHREAVQSFVPDLVFYLDSVLFGDQSGKQDNIFVADELRKFKTLLEDGIITQEEYDAKIKQLFGV